jgi:hypothetical protein
VHGPAPAGPLTLAASSEERTDISRTAASSGAGRTKRAAGSLCRRGWQGSPAAEPAGGHYPSRFDAAIG